MFSDLFTRLARTARAARRAGRTPCVHHYDLVSGGWRCCGCGDKVSWRRPAPASAGACRRRDPDQVRELLGGLIAQGDEETVAIAPHEDRVRRRLVRGVS